jgi:hypothetical protein
MMKRTAGLILVLEDEDGVGVVGVEELDEDCIGDDSDDGGGKFIK